MAAAAGGGAASATAQQQPAMSAPPTLTFAVVSRTDRPLYEADLSALATATQQGAAAAPPPEEQAHLNQFVLHAALDLVDERQWETSSSSLKVVDKFSEYVSAHVTAGRCRLLLLHSQRNDDGVKAFLSDVHDVYLRVVLNPFHDADTPITTPAFDAKVRALARKHLM